MVDIGVLVAFALYAEVFVDQMINVSLLVCLLEKCSDSLAKKLFTSVT
jgi:hypothetical protein